MADENKPTDKIDLASTELKIGGVNLKGSYIVWFFAAVATVGGGIYAAGGEWGKYQKLQEAVAMIKPADLEPLVKVIEQANSMEDAITNLMQSLAATQGEVQALQRDMQGIKTLVDANDVSKLQGAIATLRTTVEGVQVFTRDVQAMREKQVGIEKDMQAARSELLRDLASLKKDVDSQWNAIDSIGAGALKGK
jgi:hypothetical protein